MRVLGLAVVAAVACGGEPTVGMTGSMEGRMDTDCLKGAFEALRNRRAILGYDVSDDAEGSKRTILDGLLPVPSEWVCDFRRGDARGRLVLRRDESETTAVRLIAGRPGEPMGRAEAIRRMSWLDEVWKALRERCPRPLKSLSGVKRVCVQAECEYPRDKRLSGEGPREHVLGRPFKLKRP